MFSEITRRMVLMGWTNSLSPCGITTAGAAGAGAGAAAGAGAGVGAGAAAAAGAGVLTVPAALAAMYFFKSFLVTRPLLPVPGMVKISASEIPFSAAILRTSGEIKVLPLAAGAGGAGGGSNVTAGSGAGGAGGAAGSG